MTLALVVALVCLTTLTAQYRHHVYSGIKLEARVKALEARQADSYDPKAFSDLQSKVEALRLGRAIGAK